MKNKKYLVTLSLLALLTSCQKENITPVASTTPVSTSTAPANTKKDSETSTVKPTTDTTSVNSNTNTDTTPTEKKFDITDLKKGFAADVVKNDDDELDVYKVAVGDKVVQFKDYSSKNSSDEHNDGWKGANIYLKDAISYQAVTVDGDNALYFGKAYYDTYGKVQTEVVKVKDSVTGDNTPVEWQYEGFDNFFASLSNDDFAKDSDGNYALDLTKAKFTDDLKTNIKNLIYPGYNDGDRTDYTGKYSSQTLDSFVLTVDDNLAPIGYIAKITGQDNSWSSSSTKTFTGVFTSIGEGSATALSDLVTDDYLESVLEKLKTNNYKFQASKYIAAANAWVSATSQFYSGYVDGTTVIYTDGENETGYTKVDDTHYRGFDVSSKTYSSTASTDGDMFEDILCKFDFNSTFFKKIATGEPNDDCVNVYTFSVNDYFFNVANSKKDVYSNIFTPKFVKGYHTTLSTKLKVIVSDDEIEFNIQDENDPRILDVRYFGFGAVETYDVSKLAEPSSQE